MPHYDDGTETKVGDLVLARTPSGSEHLGVVVSISPETDTCNAYVRPLVDLVKSELRHFFFPTTGSSVVVVTTKRCRKLL